MKSMHNPSCTGVQAPLLLQAHDTGPVYTVGIQGAQRAECKLAHKVAHVAITSSRLERNRTRDPFRHRGSC